MEIYTLHRTENRFKILIGSYTSKYTLYKALFQQFCQLYEIVDSDLIIDHIGRELGDIDTIHHYHVYRYTLDDYYDIDLNATQTANSFIIPKTLKLLKEEVVKLERENKIASIVDN